MKTRTKVFLALGVAVVRVRTLDRLVDLVPGAVHQPGAFRRLPAPRPLTRDPARESRFGSTVPVRGTDRFEAAILAFRPSPLGSSPGRGGASSARCFGDAASHGVKRGTSCVGCALL